MLLWLMGYDLVLESFSLGVHTYLDYLRKGFPKVHNF